MKREAIEATGLLDEHFYLYYEETDWCARARDAGYTTIFVPESKVWHKVSRSMDGGTPQQVYYLSRNRLMFLSKRGMRPLAAVRRLCEFGRMAASMAFRGRPRESWAVCRGVFDFWWRHRGRA
jgi:GT2 family glycosyltransferase